MTEKKHTKRENLYNTNHKTTNPTFRDKHDDIEWSDQISPQLKIVKTKLNRTVYKYK